MPAFSEYGSFDALGLAELVRKKEVAPIDLVDAAIARIEKVNPRINSVVCRMFDDAQRRAKGQLEGPFAGVPFLVKDLLSAVAGFPLTSSSRFFAKYVPNFDAELIKRYRAAGLVIVGKTNTPEFGLPPVTEPELHGVTNNPWNVERTAGGSSGGAGASVASGMVPMAHGGDGGGSIRIPASCNGLFGLKPTRARTPVGPGASEHWHGFAIEHVLSRTVRDSAAALDATHGGEVGAPYSAPSFTGRFLDEVQKKPGKLRIAFTSRPFMPATVHADCVAAVHDAARLCEELGHEVFETQLDIEPRAFARAFFTMVCVETATEIDAASRLLGKKATPQDFETETWLVSLFGRRMTAVAMSEALRALKTIGRETLRAAESYDVLLMPTLGKPPLPHFSFKAKGLELKLQEMIAARSMSRVMKAAGGIDRVLDKVFEFASFTPLQNVTGQPSMNVPLFWNSEGLPIGTTFTSRFGDEATLLRLAAQLEEARPWASKRAPVNAFDL